MKKLYCQFLLMCILPFFAYPQTNGPCSPGKIIISEIYSDPTPSNGLPEHEYLELFNTCNDTIYLNHWKITDGSATGTIVGEKLPPGSYLILCQAKNRIFFEPYGNVYGLTTWPTLNNKTDSLTLLDQNGGIIDIVVYNLDAFPEKAKSNGGWSVEVVDPWLHCRGFDNWGFSIHSLGGTPGTANSIFRRTPDLIKPKIVHVYTPSAYRVVLEFDEPMSGPSIKNGTYTIAGNTVVNIDYLPAEKDKVFLTLQQALEEDRSYEISLRGVEDCNGNEIGNSPINFVYDNVPPELLDIRYNTFYAITCIFNEPLDKESAVFSANYLLNQHSPLHAQLIGKNHVSLTFDQRFKIDEDYLLKVRGLKDFSGNEIQDALKFDFTFFTNIDSVIIHDPYLITLIFKVKPDPIFLIRENFMVGQSTMPENISFSANNPKQVMLHLGSALKANSWSSIAVKSLYDGEGNLLQTPTREFYYDTRAPQLSSITVLDSCRIEVVFDEKIDLKTAIAVHNFETDHDAIFPSNVIGVNDSTLWLVFSKPFVNEKTYTLSVGNIQDVYLNRLPRKINAPFVYDTMPPRLLSVIPISGYKLKLKFSEPPANECLEPSNFILNHNVGSPTAVVVAGWDTSLVWLEFSKNLIESSDFQLQINNLSDTKGNKADGSEWGYFSTIYPKIAEIEVASSNEVKVVFSEEINLLTGLQSDLYLINNSATALSVTAVSKTEIICRFQNDFVLNNFNSLRVLQVVDLFGNTSANENMDFEYKKQITKVEALDFKIIRVEYNVVLDQSSILEGQYNVSPQIGAPIFYSVDQNNARALKIVLGQPLIENMIYEVEIAGITDMYGRMLPRERAGFMIDKTEPVILGGKAILPKTIEIVFSEPVDKKAAETKGFYSIPGCGNPQKALVKGENQDKVWLEFSCDFTQGGYYQLMASGIADLVGNQMVNQEISFIYQPPYEPSFNDLVITEIMAAPGNNVNFKSEYLEVYNRSADTINLSGIILADLVKSTTLGEYFLPPGKHVALVPLKEVPNFTVYGPTLGVSNWPTLNDSEDELVLVNRNGAVIFSVYYNDTWYKDSSKKKGYSLEMIDIANPCSGYYNWTASEDQKGGTPGNANSVKAENPDLTAPALTKAIAPDPNSIVLFFNERMMPRDLENMPWQYEPLVDIGSARFDGLNWGKIEKIVQSPLDPAVPYQVTINSLKDCAGNTINPQKRMATFRVCGIARKDDVLFNEILFDPRAGGVEFIELYNKVDYPINLKNWQLVVSDKAVIISSDHLVIEPGDFLVLTRNPEILKADYPKGKEDRFFKMKNMQALVNKEGVLVLTDSMGMAIDSLFYSEKMHLPLLKNKKGVSLERLSLDLSTTDANNWKSAASTASYATPGYKNSQMKIGHPNGGSFSVSPVSFSPDDQNGRNHTFINYDLDSQGFIASISIYDRVGRLVKEIARNESLGSSGAFRWDGLDESGKRVGAGYYIVFIQAFDLEGQVFKIREKVAIAY